jgi:hypothetical protein
VLREWWPTLFTWALVGNWIRLYRRDPQKYGFRMFAQMPGGFYVWMVASALVKATPEPMHTWAMAVVEAVFWLWFWRLTTHTVWPIPALQHGTPEGS